MITVLRSKDIKKTRKDHRCYGCLATIPAGSPAHVQVNTDMGVGSLYTHQSCEEIIHEIYDLSDGDGLNEGCVTDELCNLGFKGTPDEYVNRPRGDHYVHPNDDTKGLYVKIAAERAVSMDQKREQIAVLLNDLYEDTGFKRDFILGAKSIEELQGITEEQLSLAWEVIDRRVDITLAPKGDHDAYPNEDD